MIWDSLHTIFWDKKADNNGLGLLLSQSISWGGSKVMEAEKCLKTQRWFLMLMLFAKNKFLLLLVRSEYYQVKKACSEQLKQAFLN